LWYHADNVGRGDELGHLAGRRSILEYGYQPSVRTWGVMPRRHDADPDGHLAGTVLGSVHIDESLAFLVNISVHPLDNTAVIRHANLPVKKRRQLGCRRVAETRLN
jgi:hypothetical protein